jgi:amino acid transporter
LFLIVFGAGYGAANNDWNKATNNTVQFAKAQQQNTILITAGFILAGFWFIFSFGFEALANLFEEAQKPKSQRKKKTPTASDL